MTILYLTTHSTLFTVIWRLNMTMVINVEIPLLQLFSLFTINFIKRKKQEQQPVLPPPPPPKKKKKKLKREKKKSTLVRESI